MTQNKCINLKLNMICMHFSSLMLQWVCVVFIVSFFKLLRVNIKFKHTRCGCLCHFNDIWSLCLLEGHELYKTCKFVIKRSFMRAMAVFPTDRKRPTQRLSWRHVFTWKSGSAVQVKCCPVSKSVCVTLQVDQGRCNGSDTRGGNMEFGFLRGLLFVFLAALTLGDGKYLFF